MKDKVKIRLYLLFFLFILFFSIGLSTNFIELEEEEEYYNTSSPAPSNNITVAVLGFRSSFDNGQTGRDVSEILLTTLANSRFLNVIERLQIDKVIKELKLQQTEWIDPETAVKIGKLIAARYIIVGNVFKTADRIRIDARVIEVETGTVKFAERVSGNAYNLSTLAEKLGHLLLMRIANPPELPNLQKEEVIVTTNNVVYSEVLDLIGNSQIEVTYNEPVRTKDGEFGWNLVITPATYGFSNYLTGIASAKFYVFQRGAFVSPNFRHLNPEFIKRSDQFPPVYGSQFLCPGMQFQKVFPPLKCTLQILSLTPLHLPSPYNHPVLYGSIKLLIIIEKI